MLFLDKRAVCIVEIADAEQYCVSMLTQNYFLSNKFLLLAFQKHANGLCNS